MLSRPWAGPQCPLLALQALPNAAGNRPAAGGNLLFLDCYFVVNGTAGKKKINI